MGLLFRNIDYSESSPIHSYKLKDVFFSELKYFPHAGDRRNPDKCSLADHISLTSVTLTKYNYVFQGLPVPPKLAQTVAKLNGSVRHWILGYHDIDDLALFVLLPAGPNTPAEDPVDYSRDLETYQLSDRGSHDPKYSFFVDRLYIWLNTILMKEDHKIRGGQVLDVPRLFLSRDDSVVTDYKQVSRELNRKSARELVETMSAVELDRNKYFNIFYSADGVVLYLRNRFQIRKDPRIPDIFQEPNGCKWKNRDTFNFTARNLSEAARIGSINQWLRDS
jgi:hypothetical protein